MEKNENLSIIEDNGKYGVKLPQFEGPLDLLLHLIKKEQIDIYDIPMAIITEKYLEYIKLMEDLNITVAVEFLEMAATLIYIKSKMLIPVEEMEIEEEFEDPRKELVERLLEYEKFKDLAQELYVINEMEKGSYHKGRIGEVVEVEGEIINVTIFDILDAYKNVLKRINEERFVEIEGEDFSIEEAIFDLKEKLKRKKRISFFSVVKRYTRRMIVTYFIALLEICRQGIINLVQSENYDDIILIATSRKRQNG